MRTPKLLDLGTLLLVLAGAASAWAEPPVADPVATESPAPAATGQDAAEVSPAPAADGTVQAESASAAAGAVAPDPAVEPLTDEMRTAAPAEAVAAEGMPGEAIAMGDAAGPPPAAPAEPAMELGAVGYDEQGREGRIHIVRRGDTLWDISNAYLGTPWVWPSIWRDNLDIENPHWIYPEDRIWITPWEMRKLTEAQAQAMLGAVPASLGENDAAEAAPLPSPVVAAERVLVPVPDRERAGLLSERDVEGAAGVVANTAPRLMISENDRIWIGLAAGDTQVGDQYTIYRVEEKVYDPENGRMLGYHVDFLGWIEVLETHEDTSLALVRASYSEIEAGDRLMPRPPPQTEIAMTAAPAGVDGQISFLPQSRTQMGTYDYVYLNRGSVDGVEVGSPLTVYRKGFRARDSVLGAQVRVPDRPVASLLVVRTAEEASVAMVRATHEELALGDHFRGDAH